jgi:hypothetical protein
MPILLFGKSQDSGEDHGLMGTDFHAAWFASSKIFLFMLLFFETV